MTQKKAVTALDKAKKQLEKVQAAAWDPADVADAVMWAFYAYENAIVAVAEARGIRWTKNHADKARLAAKFVTDRVLKTDVADRLVELNDLRKDVAYGDPGEMLEAVNAENISGELEEFIDEVDAVVTSNEETE